MKELIGDMPEFERGIESFFGEQLWIYKNSRGKHDLIIDPGGYRLDKDSINWLMKELIRIRNK